MNAIPHDYDFDPTHGYTLDQLLAVPAPPIFDDFVAFWENTFAEARAIDLKIVRREIDSPDPACRLFEVEYNSLGDVRIGAWITVPRVGKPRQAVVVGHGYGGRDAPAFSSDLPVPEAAAIFPCVRGFQRSAHPDYPPRGLEHVMVGIDDPTAYSHRGCVADYWLAASVLETLYPAACAHLYYIGGSFGGGIGALMLPWDARFEKAFLDIPSFGNHPLRVNLPCTGSGQAVYQYYQDGHPEVLDVLRYFDAATAATLIEIPVLVAAATFDPAVPPPGQFAIYNALAGPKDLYLRQAAHFQLAGNEHDSDALHARQLRLFSPANPARRSSSGAGRRGKH